MTYKRCWLIGKLMNKNNMEMQLFLPDRPIAFNRDFVRFGIGVKGALMLSQAIYWAKRTKDPDGWFYKSSDEWEEETGLTYEEQKTARKNMGNFLICELRGLPARNYYKVNEEALAEKWREITKSKNNPQNKYEGKPRTGKRESLEHSIPESTTETIDTAGADVGVPSSLSNSRREVSVVPVDADGSIVPSRRPAQFPNAKEVFSLFPGAQAHWMKNRAIAGAAQRLHDRAVMAGGGLEGLRKVLSVYEEHKDDPYCPQIFTPLDLETKGASLKAFFAKNNI